MAYQNVKVPADGEKITMKDGILAGSRQPDITLHRG